MQDSPGDSVEPEADDIPGCADAASGGLPSTSEPSRHEIPSGPDETATSAPETASTSAPSFSLELPALKQVKDLIVLSFFDGMCSGAYALQQLGLRIKALFTWEVDTPSNRVSKSVFKGLRFERGDIAQDDAATVANMLRDMDAEGNSPLLVLAGPRAPTTLELPVALDVQGRPESSFRCSPTSWPPSSVSSHSIDSTSSLRTL